MTKRHMSNRPLTELQQAILDFLWSNGPSTAEEVREALGPRHPLKDPSVRTLLRRLEERGYLTHTVDGKVFRYEAAVEAEALAAGAVRQIIERFCAGSVEKFLVGMIDEEVLSPEDLRRLARKARERK